MTSILKFPRTPHVTGSRIQPGDEDLPAVAADAVEGHSLIVEEKLDGSNAAVSFDGEGRLILQSRGHALTGGPRERQFDLFKRWANHHVVSFRNTLGSRYVMYGEWLFARHTVAYDLLPHYFMEFDIYDRETQRFLDTNSRMSLLEGGPVHSVPVIAHGVVGRLDQLIGPSSCSSTELMEGLYLKREEAGHVIERFKYVRAAFLQAVADSETHWMDRPIEPNRLREGVDMFA